jgi:hypothetical protein
MMKIDPAKVPFTGQEYVFECFSPAVTIKLPFGESLIDHIKALPYDQVKPLFSGFTEQDWLSAEVNLLEGVTSPEEIKGEVKEGAIREGIPKISKHIKTLFSDFTEREQQAIHALFTSYLPESHLYESCLKSKKERAPIKIPPGERFRSLMALLSPAPYSFTDEAITKIKALFPGITGKQIDAIANFISEHINIGQIMDMSPATPAPDMGRVAEELHSIQAAVESLQGLLENASPDTMSYLSGAYFFQKNASVGITDKRYPRLKDVEVVLDAFKKSMHTCNHTRALVKYRQKVLDKKVEASKIKGGGSGQPPGTAKEYPGIIIDGLNEIIYPKTGLLGQTAGVKLGEILGISEFMTERYVKNWLKMMLSPKEKIEVEYESSPFEPV